MGILSKLFNLFSAGAPEDGKGLTTRTWLFLLLVFFLFGLTVGRKQGAPTAAAVAPPQQVAGQVTQTATTTITYGPKPAQNKADIQATLGKTDIHVTVNGQEQVFSLASDEAYAFEKNAIKLDQQAKVTFAVNVAPVDNTRHFALGFMAGLPGAGVTFRHDRLGLDVYKDWSAGYGANIRYEVLQW